MSSEVKKMSKEMATAEQKTKTKTINYRIDVELSDFAGIRTTYMQVTGIPEDLPVEYEDTVKHAAEAQFATALNQRLYLEFYSEGKTSSDEQPVFYNLSKLHSVKIVAITKID